MYKIRYTCNINKYATNKNVEQHSKNSKNGIWNGDYPLSAKGHLAQLAVFTCYQNESEGEKLSVAPCNDLVKNRSKIMLRRNHNMRKKCAGGNGNRGEQNEM